MDDAPRLPHARIVREKRTVAAMIEIYCRAHHGANATLCGECDELLTYALCRLDRCPFGAKKTPCARCPVHCYNATMRKRIKEIMRYAGPRMLCRHPLLAVLHQWDNVRRQKE